MLRVTAERIQVYDKLCTMSLVAHEDRLSEIFNRFQVPLKEKRKKVMLAEIICKCPGPESGVETIADGVASDGS
jgi:hypothetical protein